MSFIQQLNLIKKSTMEVGEKIASFQNVIVSINAEKANTTNVARFENLCSIVSLANRCIKDIS